MVLWTAAVVWALVDLLLLARAYPGGSLFTSAVTNWRPEYLVLLGLPVAAAATAKAVVAGANSGQGPATDPDTITKIANTLGVNRVYVRTPAGALFEATHTIGFTVDEPAEKLGQEFIISPQFADQKEELLRRLNDPIIL